MFNQDKKIKMRSCNYNEENKISHSTELFNDFIGAH